MVIQTPTVKLYDNNSLSVGYGWYILSRIHFKSPPRPIGCGHSPLSESTTRFRATNRERHNPHRERETERERERRQSSNGLEARIWREGRVSERNLASLNSQLFLLSPTVHSFHGRVSKLARKWQKLKKNHRSDFLSVSNVLGRAPLISFWRLYAGFWVLMTEFQSSNDQQRWRMVQYFNLQLLSFNLSFFQM